MRATFHPLARREFDTLFLERQTQGSGLDYIRIFLPPPVPRGRRGGGIFTVLSGLAKKAVPFLLRNVAPEAIQMGKDVLGDVLEGHRFHESVKQRRGGVEGRRTKAYPRRSCQGKKIYTLQKEKGPKRCRVAKSCYKSSKIDMKALV